MKLRQYSIAAAFLLASGLAQATTALHVTNENKLPIAGAQVVVGSEMLTTDANGNVTVSNAWTTPQTITVSAAGYLPTQFPNRAPLASDLQVHAADPAVMVNVAGETTDFGPLPKDGQVDIGLVFPAMAKRRLMQFNVAELISSEYDRIKVLTETIDLPSNVTLPLQKESYILPITFNKPTYRMQVRPNESHRMTALHGQFPLKKVVDAMRSGKDLLDVVNDIKFFGGGQKDVAVSAADVPAQNIAVNQFTFDSKVSFTAPTFAADQTLFAIGLAADQGGLFIPSDLKLMTGGEVRDLNFPAASTSRYVATLIIPKPVSLNIGAGLANELKIARPSTPEQYMALFQRVFSQWMEARRLRAELAPTASGLSLTLTPAGTAGAPQHIEIVARPSLTGNHLNLTAPALNSAITPVATYVSVAQIEKKTVGKMVTEKRTRILELFANNWVDGIDLPDLSTLLQTGKNYRFEVMYLGRDANITPTAGDYFLDEITHVSRNAYDL